MRVVHWTDEAMEQALGIRDYLAATSPSYAEQVVNQLFNRAGQLVGHPYLGPVYPKTKLR